jgi:tetratricopeptide (TPR) repeat protein
MKAGRIPLLVIASLAAVAAVAAAALYLGSRRDLTTSSGAAYKAYREGFENEQRFYFKEAKIAYAKALEADPEFAMAMLGLARLSDRDQARSLVARARQLRPRLNERERLNLDMQAAYTDGKADEGIAIARKIHEKYPSDARAAMMLAGQEISGTNPEKAIQIFNELLASDPNNASAYNQMGYFYAFRGDCDRAVECFKKYQFLAPDQANPFDSMGEVLAYSGRYDEAIASLNRALAIKPDFDPAYQHLGVAYGGKGDYPKAIASYEKAAEFAVTGGLRTDYLGSALHNALWARDKAEAQRLISELERLPKNEYSPVIKVYVDAAAHLVNGQPAEAERVLREGKPKILEATGKNREAGGPYKPYNAGWNLLMGTALERQGKDSEAIAVFEEMANPPNPWRDFNDRQSIYEGRSRLAALLARHGDVDRAAKLLAENHKWNPSWAPARAAEEMVAQASRQSTVAAAK